MELGIPMEFGPGIPVPALDGVRVVYPAWIVGAWFGLLIARLVLFSVSNRLKFEFVSLTGWDPLGWLAVPEREPRDTGEARYTVEDLEATLEWELSRWRRKARRAYRAILIAPLGEEMVFRGIPFLIALTFTL